ncbi:MAG: cytochrome c oxidase subunit II [Acetobacterales bacterium]
MHRLRLSAAAPRFFAGLVPAAALGGCSGSQSALNPKSADAWSIGVQWWAMLGVGTIILIGVTVLLLIAAWRGRGRRERAGLSDTQAWLMVIFGGIVLPAFVIVGLVVSGLYIGSGADAGVTEPDLTIEVSGRRWWWEATYLDAAGDPVATTANEIHIPVDRRVRFLLRSDNVIHSFWVPNLQGKTDLVPGVVNETWLRAGETGVYRGQCAEFCGVQHAFMAFLVVVDSVADFDRWLRDQAAPAAAPETAAAVRGLQTFMRAGCDACHTIRGTGAQGELGPDLTHLASRRTLAAATMPNTTGHLGGWIADPQHVKPGNLMPSTIVEPERFRDLLAYLESLR